MEPLRQKSKTLTGFLEQLLDRFLANDVRLITPRNPEERGCQLSIQLLRADLSVVHSHLESKGIICDTRQPDVMRIAPVPMYNKHIEVYKFVAALQEVICKNVSQGGKA